MRFGLELRKTVALSDAVGTDWNLRFVTIPVILNLVKVSEDAPQLPE
jgi:hypothetical protein